MTNPEEYFKSIEYTVPVNQLDAVVTNLIKLASKDSSLEKEVVGDWGEYVVNICNVLATNGKNPEFTAYWEQATTGVESIQESSIMSFREAKGFAKKLGILAALALLTTGASLSASSLDNGNLGARTAYPGSYTNTSSHLTSYGIETNYSHMKNLQSVESSAGSFFLIDVVKDDTLSNFDINQYTKYINPKIVKQDNGRISIELDIDVVLEDVDLEPDPENIDSMLKNIFNDLSDITESKISQAFNSLSESEKANLEVFCEVTIVRESIYDWNSITTEQQKLLLEGQIGIPHQASVNARVYHEIYHYNSSQLMQNSYYRSYRNRLTENITLPNGVVVKPQESKEDFTGTKSELIAYLKSK